MRHFEIKISGENENDIVYALEEIKKWVEKGYTSGQNGNDTGEYSFNSSEDS